jgi:hypothetical protein
MLKAAAFIAASFLLIRALPAAADTLVTGVVRDRTGAAVFGARIAAYDGAGHALGTDVTVAVAAGSEPAELAVACDYCRTTRVAVEPGQPAVVIVERYNDVTATGPSPDDIRALPYRSAPDIASLRPFSVVGGGQISDRGLDYEGANLVDGLPFYRVADGNEFVGLIPAHAMAALNATGPLAAPLYGGYADAGVDDLRLYDADTSTSRFDLGDASDAAVRLDGAQAGAGYATSSDTGDDRQAAYADAALPFAGGRLGIDALGMADLGDHASGAGIAYATDSRRSLTSASLSATQSDDASLITAAAQIRARDPFGLTFGVRADRTTAELDAVSGAQFDAAVDVAATHQAGTGTLSAIAAWDRAASSGVNGSAPDAGLVGSLADDVRLGPFWALHAGVVSNLRAPAFDEIVASAPAVASADRSLLFEQSLTFEDLRRLRVTGIAYTQRSTGSATGFSNGLGIDSAWQIAPQLVLRSWVLRANQTAIPNAAAYSAYDAAPPTFAAALTRQLLWFTYGSGVRVDAVARGGPLEGDVRIPVGGGCAFTIGSAQYNGRRVTTFGVTRL